MLTNQQVFQLDADIRAAGILIIGISNTDGSREGISIQFNESETAEQQAQAWAIVDNYFI